MTSPANDTDPPSGRVVPHTQLKSVVLPAPLGPTTPTASPTPTSIDTSDNAWRPPKRLDTSRTARSGSGAGIGDHDRLARAGLDRRLAGPSLRPRRRQARSTRASHMRFWYSTMPSGCAA